MTRRRQHKRRDRHQGRKHPSAPWREALLFATALINLARQLF